MAATKKTRTNRSDPSKYAMVPDWGWTHVPWPDFVKRFPEAAKAFAENYVDGWTEAEITGSGGRDILAWDVLWDEEPYVTKDGMPVMYSNITGPGGSLFLVYKDGEWDEGLFDDDGRLESTFGESFD